MAERCTPVKTDTLLVVVSDETLFNQHLSSPLQVDSLSTALADLAIFDPYAVGGIKLLTQINCFMATIRYFLQSHR